MGSDALAAFARTNMGWLTPEGELLACDLHGHMERLATVPSLSEAYDRYRDVCDGNETAMQEDLDALGPDEHPSMHRFDGMNDEAKAELVKAVYVAGWVRLGRALDIGGVPTRDRTSVVAAFRAAARWYVEAEGLSEPVRRHRKALEDVAGALGCRLVVRGMRYAAVNMGTARRPRIEEHLVPEGYGTDAGGTESAPGPTAR